MNIVNEKNKVFELFENGKDIVLATSANDKVTTRVVTCMSYNDALYILSIERPGANKIEQIKENPNVAINSNTIQITATAELSGYSRDEVNSDIMQRYQEKLPESYARFALIPTCIVIKINLNTYKNWELINGNIESTLVDFTNDTVNTYTI